MTRIAKLYVKTPAETSETFSPLRKTLAETPQGSRCKERLLRNFRNLLAARKDTCGNSRKALAVKKDPCGILRSFVSIGKPPCGNSATL
ncbi:hypothetical protein ACFFUE_00750 [Bergeyella porcorum]|uniref:hypothetical protein n=1 Tax=Bergeyella porcorum TaxID=1735111 RepID=UPI0035E96EEB